MYLKLQSDPSAISLCGYRYSLHILLIVAMTVMSHSSFSQEGEPFKARWFRGSSGLTMPYRLFVPETVDTARLPLVVFLHGSGKRGYHENIYHRLIYGGHRYLGLDLAVS